MPDSDPMLFKIMESLGALRADVQNLKDDQVIERQTGADFRREVRHEISTVKEGVAKVDTTLKPVADAVKQHSGTLEEHGRELKTNKVFRDRIGAVIAIGATGVSTVFGGIVYLFTTYWADLIAMLRGWLARG